VRPTEETDQGAHSGDPEQASLVVENDNGNTSLMASSSGATVPPSAGVQTFGIGLVSGLGSIVGTEVETGGGVPGGIPSLGRNGGIPPPPPAVARIPQHNRRRPRLHSNVVQLLVRPNRGRNHYYL
jgi:hypothetical protein